MVYGTNLGFMMESSVPEQLKEELEGGVPRSIQKILHSQRQSQSANFVRFVRKSIKGRLSINLKNIVENMAT